jgi:hypothetical protein
VKLLGKPGLVEQLELAEEQLDRRYRSWWV